MTNDSRLLDHRTPRERVERVAPWLTLDGNAYPVVVDGRVLWVIDGYTTTDMYPYSEMATLDAATSDSVTRTRDSVQAIRSGQINYVRNSVKATVDAYDGTVKLYQWDDKDPILTAWMKIFPDALTPLSEIKGSLMEHLRYPEDLFKIQRQLLTKYHETDASSFYGGQTFWRVPLDPTRGTNAEQSLLQPAYYLSLAMPGQEEPAFSLTSTFMPVGDRNLLTGFLAADGDAGSEDGKRAPVTAGSDCSSRRAPRSRARGRSTTTCGRPRCPPATRALGPWPSSSRRRHCRGPRSPWQPAHAAGRRWGALRPADLRAGLGSRRLPAPVRGSRRLRREDRLGWVARRGTQRPLRRRVGCGGR